MNTSKESIHVLLIEDNAGDTRLIREMLVGPSEFGPAYEVSDIENIGAAAEELNSNTYDVVLLDLNLPDSTGIDTLDHLHGLAPHLPIVIMSGLSDHSLTLQLVQHGAQDYILKGEWSSLLLKRIIHYAIERKRVEEQLKYLATHDPLTGLPNRLLFYDRLAQALHRSKRDRKENKPASNWKGAVMLLDIDQFKAINDSLGHEAGDAVLQLVAQRLKASLRASDTVARLGGDEFILLIEDISDRKDCLFVGKKILHLLSEPFSLGSIARSLRASLGISIFPDDTEEIEALIKYADRAMYTAKSRQGQIHFYRDGN